MIWRAEAALRLLTPQRFAVAEALSHNRRDHIAFLQGLVFTDLLAHSVACFPPVRSSPRTAGIPPQAVKLSQVAHCIDAAPRIEAY